jgi:hypothetical protein
MEVERFCEMDYKTNELGLTELFQRLEVVPNTLPPVYMLDDILIGYDRAEKIRVIAGSKRKVVRHSWFHALKDWSNRLAR